MRKNPGGGPERIRDEPTELLRLRQSYPASFREPFKAPGKDEAGSCDEITFTQHDVGGEVVRAPTLEHRGCVRPDFLEELAQGEAFQRVERKLTHRGQESTCAEPHVVRDQRRRSRMPDRVACTMLASPAVPNACGAVRGRGRDGIEIHIGHPRRRVERARLDPGPSPPVVPIVHQLEQDVARTQRSHRKPSLEDVHPVTVGQTGLEQRDHRPFRTGQRDLDLLECEGVGSRWASWKRSACGILRDRGRELPPECDDFVNGCRRA